MNIYLFRLYQTIRFGWKDAKNIVLKHNVSRLRVYLDILRCFSYYRMRSLQYVREDFWVLNKDEREEKGNKYRIINTKTDEWTVESYENRKFLNKWKNYRWELSGEKYHKRLMAYTNRYNMGKNCIVHHDVVLERQHGLDGRITIGNNVLLAKHVYIDYSGEVTVSDNVKLSAGVTIESHSHEFSPGANEYKAIPTSVTIEEGVWVGQKAMICDSCKTIGRYAQIGAGAVIRTSIPPYSIVIGNPAKIVGFVLNPDEVEVFEEKNFPNDPIDLEQYNKSYEKYFITRIKEIKQFTKL